MKVKRCNYIPEGEITIIKDMNMLIHNLVTPELKELQQENKELIEINENKQKEIDKLVNYIEQIRKMLYKRHLDDYDVYTANVLCDMQSEFEEILRGE
jgi:predicted nuclease with TOPRIM domain